MSDGQQQRGGIGSTILVVVLVVGMLLIFNFLRKGSGGGCMGAGTPTQTASTNDNVPLIKGTDIAKPLELENSKVKVRILGWASLVGFRIDQVELKDYTMRESDSTTGKVPVRLLEATQFFSSARKLLGTWDDSVTVERLENMEFKTRPHAGFEVISNEKLSFDALETTSLNDSTLMFVWRDSLGNERKILLTVDGYEIKITNIDTLSVPIGFKFLCEQGLSPTEPGDKTELTMYQLYYRDGQKKVQYLNSKKIGKINSGKSSVEPGPYEWIALRNKYFTAIVLPSQPVVARILPGTTEGQRINMTFDVEGIRKFTLYFGPQDYETLAKMGHKLSRIVELGGSAFRWLGVIMLKVFQFFYRIIGNYGIAIIVFSILIKLVFLPLSQVQQRSMQKMQVLQPKLKELQERFKDDKQRLNEETMKLYKLHGASPFKGCLPMLVQLPVFFGLYAVLRNAINLRGAPFVKLFTVTIVKNPEKAINIFNFIRIPAGELTWLADLSQHDPFYILPILMGVASVFQSLMTNPNPQQRLMTFMMPIFITVIFLNFPSGLQLYWFLFNLLSILEFAIFRRGMKAGGDQWQPKRPKEIASARSLPKSSRR